MDLLNYPNSPSLRFPVHEQQSSFTCANAAPRLRATIDASSRGFWVCSAKVCPRSFSFDWMPKQYGEDRPSYSRGEVAEHCTDAMLEESCPLARAACRQRRIGATLRCKTKINGHWIQNLGEELYCRFPARKVRKLVDAVSYDVHVSSFAEWVSMALDDSEGLEDGLMSDGQFSGRKRRWLNRPLKWEDPALAAGASGALVGLRELYDRMKNLDLECPGGDDPGQKLGSGGNGGGSGHGGDGEGGDQLGPEEFGANDEGYAAVDMDASEQVMEEEEKQASDNVYTEEGGGPVTQKQETDNIYVAIKNRIMQMFSSSSEESQESLMVSSSDGTAQHLGRAISGFYSDLGKYFLCHEPEVKTSLSSLSLSPDQVHDSVDGTSWNHNDCERQAGQDLKRPSGIEGFAEPVGMELVEKLRKLHLDTVQPSPVGEDQLWTAEQGSTGRAEESVHEETVNGLISEEHPITGVTGLERVNTFQRQKVPLSNNELSTNTSKTVRQPQGVVNWLAGLARFLIVKQKPSEEGKVKDLINETVASAVKQFFETEGSLAPVKRSETEALRRLLREAFSDLLKIRERVDKIEHLSGSRRSNGLGNPAGAARTHLKGEVKAGTAFVLLEDSSSRHSRASLEQAGIQTGLDVRFTFETSFREKDLLVTQCVAGQGSSVGDGRALGGPITLGKVLYLAHIHDDISISFVPLGAQGKDVTEIINPLQDQGLTVFSSNGPALLNHCKGSALGATVSGSTLAFSCAQYLSGWGNHISAEGPAAADTDPLCLSTLGQVLFQPSEHIIFSLSGLNRYWPSPPLPSSIGLHWSEMGPLVIPKIQSLRTSRSTMTSQASTSTSVSHASNIGSNWAPHGLEDFNDSLESKGTTLRSFALASEIELGENISIGGWAQLERGDWLQDSEKGNFQWAVNVAKTSGIVVDWGASIGGSQPDIWSSATTDQEAYPGYLGGVGQSHGPQLQLEAFLRINCGRGFTLQPGLLYMLNKHSHTPAVMVRSSWSL